MRNGFEVGSGVGSDAFVDKLDSLVVSWYDGFILV